MKQNTTEWHEMRRNHIGASDAPVIMNVSPWRTPFQLWEEKLGVGEKQVETSAMRFGKENEEVARQAYENYTGNLIAPEVVHHPEHKFMMASLDGITMNRDIIVEIKNSNREDHENAKNGIIPEKYIPQLQHQLDCLKAPVLHYWSFHNNEGVLVETGRDEKYIKKLVAEEKKFWDYVLNFQAPPFTDRDYIDLNDDEDWAKIIREAEKIKKVEEWIKSRKEKNRMKAKERCNSQSAKGSGAIFYRSLKAGNIDYKSVPQLEGLDLSSYRKPSTETWVLRFLK